MTLRASFTHGAPRVTFDVKGNARRTLESRLVRLGVFTGVWWCGDLDMVGGHGRMGHIGRIWVVGISREDRVGLGPTGRIEVAMDL